MARAGQALRVATILATVAARAFAEDVTTKVVPNGSSPAAATFQHAEYVNYGGLRTHVGIDILAGAGSKVYPFADGVIHKTCAYTDEGECSADFGNAVMVWHKGLGDGSEDLYSIYLHFQSAPTLIPGTPVFAGSTEIGTMGQTGSATGPHTHFEIRDFPDWLWTWGNIYCPGDCRTSSDIAAHWEDPQNFVPGGGLVKTATGNEVYWSQNGRHYHVASPYVLDTMHSTGALGWSWSSIGTVASLPPVPGPTFLVSDSRSDGLLLRDPSRPEVYMMEGGKRRWIRAWEALNWLGRPLAADVVEVPGPALSSLAPSVGHDIYAIGQDENDATVRAAIVAAYERNAADAQCASLSSWTGWPGAHSRCLEFPITPVRAAYASGASGIPGKFQNFGSDWLEKGTINHSGRGTFSVHGAIFSKYRDLGFSGSALGFPISDEYAWNGYRRSDFESGHIRWNPSTNVTEVVWGSVQPTIRVTSPGNGETWTVGARRTIAWTSSNLSPSALLGLWLATPNRPEYWTWLGNVSPTTTSFTFTVPDKPSPNAYVYVWSRVVQGGVLTTEAQDWSDGMLTITAASPDLPTRAVTWTNPAKVTVTGSSLKKSVVGSAWNAGAMSMDAIVSGEGFAEFTALEANRTRAFGLSQGDSARTLTDIDFAIHLSGTAVFSVYERGVFQGSFGSYTAGDRFRVSVSDGVIGYWRNGNLFHLSSARAQYPLLVDTSLYSPQATISEALLGGSDLAENVAWTNGAGLAIFASNLRKTATTGWNAGASSTRALASDGYAEFTATETSSDRIFGLGHGDPSRADTDLDFGVRLDSQGLAWAEESGSRTAFLGSYATGDRFRITVQGGTVTYWRGPWLLHTSASSPVMPLLVDASFYTSGATLAHALLRGDRLVDNVRWVAPVGVTVLGNGLRKKNVYYAWNAGAFSGQSLDSGDGYVEWSAALNTTARLCGLNQGNLNATAGDVDFALFLGADGQLAVLEGGVQRTLGRSYLPGDRFRISVESGTVRYWRNGTLLYTSGVPPAYPLVVDTSLYTPGSVLDNVVLAREPQ